MHIIDIIRETDMAISLIVCDKAYSAAAMILAAGQKGRRFCMQHSRIMIHEISTQINGQYSSIRNLSENVMLTNRIVNELMAKSTGKKVKEIEEAVSYDHFMTAEAAVEFGIVDSIVELSDLYKKRRLL
ncbi:MAG: ATP-dependent Clp protease proteolytic subunit [Lachnospiraceae bacterium]|nr:ATP-dependent Clp protease proteolytic subunit [Lachnospiraceae bacterium]